MSGKLIVFMLVSYLSGSIPFGYILTKIVKGIDIRHHGSGNPGATNVFRVVGKVPGIITFLLDALKGFIPVMLAGKYFGSSDETIIIVAGLMAISGHVWTIFLKFKGGKGVATTAGVFAALIPIETAGALLVFSLVLALTKYVSVGSICAAISLAALTFFVNSHNELKVFSLFAAGLIIFTHRNNLKRLINGTENKVTTKYN